MDYETALQHVEQWLQQTGIRRHCRTECQGTCCIGYCGQEHYCNRPPLTCSVYICPDMARYIMDIHQEQKYRDNYVEILQVFTGENITLHTPDEFNTKRMIPDHLIEYITNLDVIYNPKQMVTDHKWHPI